MFESRPIKVTLISDLLCYGPAPKPGDEIAQRITINNKGQVWFSAKTCSDYSPLYEVPLRKTQTRINADIATDILNRITIYFLKNPVRYFMTDGGSWEMKLTFEDENVIKESGSLHCCSELNEISNLIRSALPDLGIIAYGEDNNEDSKND